VAQLDGVGQQLVEGDEDGDLNDHRQTPAQRVDLVRFVELHDGRVHLLLVVLVALLDLVELGLDLLHLFHRLVALVAKRPEQELREHRDEDDHETVVAHILVEVLHEKEDRVGEPLHPVADVDGRLEPRVLRLEAVVFLRSHEKGVVEHARLPRGDRVLRAVEGDDDLPPRVPGEGGGCERRLLGDHGCEEKLVFEAAPLDVGSVSLFLQLRSGLPLCRVLGPGDGPLFLQPLLVQLLEPPDGEALVQGGIRGVDEPHLEVEGVAVRQEGIDLLHAVLTGDGAGEDEPAGPGTPREVELLPVGLEGDIAGQVDRRAGEGRRQGELGALLDRDHFNEGAPLVEGRLVFLELERLEGAAAGAENGRVQRGLYPDVLCGRGGSHRGCRCGPGGRGHRRGADRRRCRGLGRLGLGLRLGLLLLLGLEILREEVLVDEDDDKGQENRQKCPYVRAHEVPPGARLPDRIVAAGMKGVAAQQPPDPEKDAPGRSVPADRRQGVLGAGRGEAAAWRQDGGDKDLVGPDESDGQRLEKMPHHVQAFIRPARAFSSSPQRS